MNTAKTASDGRATPALLAWRWFWLALLVLVGATVVAWQQAPQPVAGHWAEQPGSFWKPMETNAHRRLPTVANAMASVTFLPDGLRGWAVGREGTILATTNGGQNWVPQTSGTQQDLQSVSFQPDGLRGWAVGGSLNDGTILATTNGGQTWAPQSSGTQEGLQSVSFQPDGLRGWAVGDGGTILATTNGGQTWAPQSSGTYAKLNSVSFQPDGLRGWAVGGNFDDGTILATTNGGQTWAPLTSPKQELLISISFQSDGLRGWAVGKRGTILATTNGGQTWAPQTSGMPEESINSVSFQPGGLRGWAVGSRGTILATTNGGQTWAPQSSGTRTTLISVSFLPDGLRGWAVGASDPYLSVDGVILATSNGGQTWAPQTRGTQARLNSVSFLPDGLRGWAVGDRGTILATTNGGQTWAPQSSGMPEGSINSVSFLPDGLRGWAVGDRGTILATTNGGQTWAPQSSGMPEGSINSVSFQPDGLRGRAVDSGGTILTTTNGGQTWAPQSSGAPYPLGSVSFQPDGLRGWAVGGDGTILATTNGGQTWAPQTRRTQTRLISVSFLPDGLRGWAVGDGGTILATTNGGQTWAPQTRRTQTRLISVSFLPDGLRGWAVGDGGTILATTNGGQTWAPQTSGTQAWLFSVTFQPDGLRGWAVGDDGTILSTTNGGKSWRPAESYSRAPAPWYWLAVLLSAGLIGLSWWLRPQGAPRKSVADVAASDAEVRAPADDRLQFGGLARGISRFLRNTETRPPLTLAITGDWGSGKSSLMQLTCADLRRFGMRPIWFNAWHHQKEEHLFAALLGAVHAQAVPPWLSLQGPVFRLRLLWLRSRRHFAVSLALVATTTALVCLSWQAFDHGGMNSLTQMARDLATTVGKSPSLAEQPGNRAVGAAASLLSALLALFGLLKGTKVFGANPAVLLANVREGMSLKAAAAQNDFRAQFAQQFGQLAKALPYRLVIVIDDLDRCRPAAVLDVMEAVNYLTSAGECFVIFGMAAERVQAALGLAFKDIAAEMVHLASANGAPRLDGDKGAANDKDKEALDKRRAYASDYLQKLVNIEITVPKAKGEDAHKLLHAPAPEATHRLTASWGGARRLWPLAATAAAVTLGIWGSTVLGPLWLTDPQGGQSAPTAASAAAPTSGPSSPSPVSIKPSQPETNPNELPQPGNGTGFSPGASVDGWTLVKWSALAVLPLAITGVWILVWLLRRAVLQTQDSDQFRDALATWAPVIAAQRATPRAIKRFGNRLRYLAMLQQGEALDETVLDSLSAAVRQWLRRGDAAEVDAPADAQANLALKEHQLIALGAFYEVFGPQWKDGLKVGSFGSIEQPPDAVHNALYEAVRKHTRQFDAEWPPSAEELSVFERLINGVRLAGDPQTIEPSSRSNRPSSDSSSTPA